MEPNLLSAQRGAPSVLWMRIEEGGGRAGGRGGRCRCRKTKLCTSFCRVSPPLQPGVPGRPALGHVDEVSVERRGTGSLQSPALPCFLFIGLIREFFCSSFRQFVLLCLTPVHIVYLLISFWPDKTTHAARCYDVAASSCLLCSQKVLIGPIVFDQLQTLDASAGFQNNLVAFFLKTCLVNTPIVLSVHSTNRGL